MNKKIILIIGIAIITIAVTIGIILTEGGYLDSKSESDKTSMQTGYKKENASGLEVVSEGEGVTEPGASYDDVFGKAGNKSDKKTKNDLKNDNNKDENDESGKKSGKTNRKNSSSKSGKKTDKEKSDNRKSKDNNSVKDRKSNNNNNSSDNEDNKETTNNSENLQVGGDLNNDGYEDLD